MQEDKNTNKQVMETSGLDFVLSPSQGRQKENMKAAILGLFMNILLAALKMFIGVISGSIAILADGWNNLSDSFSSVVSIVSLAMASKPADKEHPFGHARFEYIASSVIAIGMLIVAVQLGYQSLLRTVTPQPLKTDIWTLVALFASIGVKLFQFFFYRYRGKKIISTVLLSAAQDSLADVWATSGVLVATTAYALWGLNIDGPAGLLVSLLIAWSAIGIIREMVTLLIGSKPPVELTETIIERILETDRRILGVHDLIVHNSRVSSCLCF
jgi:cation diffusion facilitator family transporter